MPTAVVFEQILTSCGLGSCCSPVLVVLSIALRYMGTYFNIPPHCADQRNSVADRNAYKVHAFDVRESQLAV